MKKDNEAYNINQCVNECPDKYLVYNDNLCKRCYDYVNTNECITSETCFGRGGKIFGFYCYD